MVWGTDRTSGSSIKESSILNIMKNNVTSLPKPNTMKQLLFVSVAFLFLLLTNVQSTAQQGISINTRGAAPDSNAILDVSSTTKGALFPRMTTSQRLTIDSPAIGLTVFDLDKRTYWYYAGSEWVEMTTNKDEWTSEDNSNSRASDDWNTQGNSISAGAFIGSTNNQPLLFKANGTERMRIIGTGNVGIGTQNPTERLEVVGGGRAFFGDGQGNTRKGLLIDGIEGTNASRIETYDYSIPGGRNLVINTIGGGFVGINNSNPHAPLQFANNAASRKIVLWEFQNNNYQYSGFGIDSAILRYNVPSVNTHHVFYAGTSSTTNKELMRIKGDGNVGIDASDPKERLEVGGDGRAFFGDGQGNARKGLLIDGLEGTNASRIEAYDYSIPGGRNLVINTFGNGNVGIGTDSPEEKLHVEGNTKITGNLDVTGIVENENWTYPQLSNGNNLSGSTYPDVSYYKDKENRVHIRGTYTRTNSTDDLIFILDEDSKPAYTEIFLGDFVLPDQREVCRIIILPTGEVKASYPYINGTYSLNGISFRAEN